MKEVKGDPEAGDIVDLRDHAGRLLGKGFYNPHSLISLRLLTREDEEIDFGFFERRIRHALTLRKRLYPASRTYRLVHGEGDFLPGLVIDKYEEYFSVQAFSFGMDARLTLICDVLDSLFRPKGIVERNESSARTLEGLAERKGILRGTIAPVIVTERDIKYQVDILDGQKTGLFLDQRENRPLIRRYASGTRVLDCFCNDGGFALHAAKAGAREVHGVDSSEPAVARAQRNAELNTLKAKCSFHSRDVFEFLKTKIAEKETYDIIVLDPPSFAKSRRTVATAKRGYREINENAMHLLSDGGILATASCSHHIPREMFLDMISESARRAGRRVQLLELQGAAPDHPVLPAMPETEYLKFGIFQVV